MKILSGAKVTLGEAWVAPHCPQRIYKPLLKKSKTAAVFFYTARYLLSFAFAFYSRFLKNL